LGAKKVLKDDEYLQEDREEYKEVKVKMRNCEVRLIDPP